MREETITYKIFSFDELSPEAQKKAIERRREQNQSDPDMPWQREIFESLEGLIKACNGITLKDYSLGMSCYSWIKVSFSQEESEDLSGSRAMAWLENNLLSNLRIPFTGKKRRELAQYGSEYRPGKIKPCPFTGYCADDDYLDHLIKQVRAGNTLKESFESLAKKYQEILETEYEWQCSDEYIKEELADTEFLESGKVYF